LPATAPGCAILLSTYNGAPYLPAFLDSLLTQSEAGWVLLWRDDGSLDETVSLITAWGDDHPGRLRPVTEPVGNQGVVGSFMALLRAADGAEAPAIAFADQDDVWLPEKLARALAALDGVPAQTPALYCARQILVAGDLRKIGLSASLMGPAGFPACLTQNIATGCTVALNRAAIRRVAASRPPREGWHDWWCYILVSAAGGAILRDETPVILYRQHAANVVGAPSSAPRRALAAMRRGPSAFMSVFRKNVAALQENAEGFDPLVRAQLDTIALSLASGPIARLRALVIPGFQRNSSLQTALFRLWFIMG
jgi:glycosyltransferase involved in cell wall biosynthesis